MSARLGTSHTPSHAVPVRTRSLRVAQAALAALALAGACSTAGPSPATDPAYPKGSHELACEYVGLEAVQGPPDAPDQDADSVSMLATYRFSDSATPQPRPQSPLSVKFQVSRDRVNELRDELSSRPQVLCHPHGQSGYAPDATAMPGISGEPYEVPP